jgi:hypothetical protein
VVKSVSSVCNYCPSSYTRHDFSKPDADSQFTIGITDQFSLDSTILNTAGPEGIIFMDSTHRLQNENWAATTVFCTANAERHMMPGECSSFLYPVAFLRLQMNAGAYLLSANIKASTLENWILETIKKIEVRAQEVVAG